MFKCTVCQKLYTSKVQYCDCGNDEFLYIEDSAPSYSSQKRESRDLISPAIFLVCLILSAVVLFWFNPVKTRHHSQQKTNTAITEINSDIPDINAVWNDKPAYTPVSTNASSMEVYKKSLQNMLNSNIQPKQFSGTGHCTIEFTVANNGKLVNRKMFKDEGSNEFNKIVLNMLKNTNEHRIPPSDYLGEKISGDVVVQDGLIKLYIK